MNTPTNTGPLFRNVNELHEALLEYARQALQGALRSREPWHTESIAGDPVDIIDEKKLAVVFDAAARERFAQIASALWMEREAAEERQKSGIVVDGEPLNAVEEAIYAVKFAASLEIAKAEECVRHHRMVRRLLEAARAARATGIIR